MNAIIYGYPNCIEVGSSSIEIDTDFRVWLMILEALNDDELTNAEKARTLFELAGIPRQHQNADAVKALTEFSRAGFHGRGGSSGAKSFDFGWDCEEIIASFQMQYSIDLTSKDTTLHWWRFMALFRGLGEQTPIMKVIRIRTAELPSGNSEDSRKERARLSDLKKQFALPAMSYREQVKRDRDVWGD